MPKLTVDGVLVGWLIFVQCQQDFHWTISEHHFQLHNPAVVVLQYIMGNSVDNGTSIAKKEQNIWITLKDMDDVIVDTKSGGLCSMAYFIGRMKFDKDIFAHHKIV